MKLIWKILIPIMGAVTILVLMLVIPVIILDKSWWWFFGTLIFFIVIGIIIGAIIMIIKLGKKSVSKIKMDVKSAKKRAVHEMKYEDDNPDNFRIDHSRIERWGEKGAERTPILILDGKGTEKNQRRVVILNLNNPKQEATKLINPTDEQIKEYTRLMAEHPPEEIREERIMGSDEWGRPTTRLITRRPSSIEKAEEEEKKKTEEQVGI